MQIGQPSQTAMGTAAFRILHAHAFPGPAIHQDDVAMALLDVADPSVLLEMIAAAELPELESVCAFFAFRHRFAEDHLQRAIDRGIDQVVVLGAGLDTFALRHPDLVPQIRFFEVDHPETQAAKLAAIERAGLPRPGVRFVAVDFERDQLGERLTEAGFEVDRPAFVSWLGVSLYVERPAALRTFQWVADAAPGSEVVFDIVLPLERQDDRSRMLSEAYAAASAERGEPWVGFFTPEGLTDDLTSLGFAHVQVLAPDDAARRYYSGQPEGVEAQQAWLLARGVV